MKSANVRLTGFLTLFFAFSLSFACAQTPPASQTAGGQARQQKDQESQRAVEKKITGQKPAAAGSPAGAVITEDNGPKTLIKTITVEGAVKLSQDEIRAVTARYEGKELSMKGIQKVADLLTDEYRKKGLVTSRAYVPPQTVKDGTLIIRVVEGKIGSLEIRGNRYFGTSMLRDKFEFDKDGYFDFSALQRSLVYINESSDRVARSTLVPGKEPGTTDVILDVQDRLPIHAGFEFDNWGSEFIGKERYSGILEDNNLFGIDDKLYLKYQWAEAEHMALKEGRYTLPVNRDLSIGIYALTDKIKLGKDFVAADSRGDADIFGIFVNQALVSRQDLDLRLNVGFDYKRIRNYVIGTRVSRDAERVFRTGVDIDMLDSWGRNIISPEVQVGVPGIMGGMKAKDPDASRAGAGGDFTKGLLTYFRLQKMPFNTSFLWKNYAQYTDDKLTSSEQFQIGGPTSVRGYPPAEFSGDRGIYTSPELSVPLYFLPKGWNVPTQRESLYDTTRFVFFYDWATERLNAAEGVKKAQTLIGWGLGFRFNLRDNLTFRVEVGYPLGKTPSDGYQPRPWVEFTSKF